MNYEKLSLETFTAKLKEGKYESATGARRAVGKTSWKQSEKEKAQALINGHFGEGATTAKPAAKKPAVAKKTAKKIAVKRAKAAPVAHTEEAPQAKKPPVVRRQPQVASEKNKAPYAGAATTPTTIGDAVQMSHSLLSVVSATRAELDKARKVAPSEDYSPIEKELRDLMHRGLSLVNASVPTGSESGAPHVTLPRSAPVVSPSTSVSVKTAPAPVAHPHVPHEPPPGDIKPAPAPMNGESNLTPEEQRIADEIRNAQPATGLGGLPKPIVPSHG